MCKPQTRRHVATEGEASNACKDKSLLCQYPPQIQESCVYTDIQEIPKLHLSRILTLPRHQLMYNSFPGPPKRPTSMLID